MAIIRSVHWLSVNDHFWIHRFPAICATWRHSAEKHRHWPRFHHQIQMQLFTQQQMVSSAPNIAKDTNLTHPKFKVGYFSIFVNHFFIFRREFSSEFIHVKINYKKYAKLRTDNQDQKQCHKND